MKHPDSPATARAQPGRAAYILIELMLPTLLGECRARTLASACALRCRPATRVPGTGTQETITSALGLLLRSMAVPADAVLGLHEDDAPGPLELVTELFGLEQGDVEAVAQGVAEERFSGEVIGVGDRPEGDQE